MAKGPEHQHYVPKFILKNFSRDPQRRQVPVFQKSSGKGFTASIAKIMGETRFHEFTLNDAYRASFEESIGKIENWLLPTYRRILRDRRLTSDDDERSTLAMFIAFQFIRTRRQRDRFVEVEDLLAEKLSNMGGNLSDLDGYIPLDRDALTAQHINFMRRHLAEFTAAFADKEFLLMQPPPGRSFWLADDPVCMHNSQPADPFWGNIGLAVRGIEVYLPISHDLMIAALCPTLAESMRKQHAELQAKTRATADDALKQAIPFSVVGAFRQKIATTLEPLVAMLEAMDEGTPLSIDDTVMDFACSLQLAYARDFIILPRGDYQRARKFLEHKPPKSDSSRP